MRLADPEILKRHEYFGKFGKIHKVVINQSPSYAGSQGPSASKKQNNKQNDKQPTAHAYITITRLFCFFATPPVFKVTNKKTKINNQQCRRT